MLNLNGFKRGQLVAYSTRLRTFRKVLIVVGPSRVLGKIRVRVWADNSRRWSGPRTELAERLVPAPTEWPATRRARHAINSNLVDWNP